MRDRQESPGVAARARPRAREQSGKSGKHVDKHVESSRARECGVVTESPVVDTGASGAGKRLAGTARVLLITDQPVLAKLISLTLDHGTFAVRVAPTIAEGLARLARGDPHLVILDMDLDATGSGRVMDEIGHEGSRAARVPVIALTRRGDLHTTLAAFDRGVDDIITVPFSPEELLARALAVVRRAYRETIAFAPVVRVGDLEIDIYRRRVRAGAADLRLTPLEQNLLYLLAANAGRLLGGPPHPQPAHQAPGRLAPPALRGHCLRPRLPLPARCRRRRHGRAARAAVAAPRTSSPAHQFFHQGRGGGSSCCCCRWTSKRCRRQVPQSSASGRSHQPSGPCRRP